MSNTNLILALAVLFTVASASADLPIIPPGTYYSFTEYKGIFKKNYTESQLPVREALYNAKVKEIKQTNQNSKSEKQTINNFTDWDDTEIAKLSGNKVSYSNALGFSNTEKLRTKLQSSGDNKLQSAASLDWRTLGAVTSIKDQGNCGSCWAFATIAQAESHLIIRNRADSTIGLSQQFLLKCTSGSDCISGGYLQDAANVVISKGCPYRSQFPYDPTSLLTTVCNGANSYFKVAKKASFYYGLTDTQIINLLQTSPLAIAVSSSGWSSYSSGIKTCSSTAALNHAVQLVGYDTTYWIVKNQWGTGWGQSGYIYINRDRTNSYTNCFVGSIVVQFEGDPSGEIYYLLAHLAILMIFMFI